jgi:hypothetical protein
MKKCYFVVNILFDKIEEFWESRLFKTIISAGLFILFAVVSLAVYLKNAGFLPESFKHIVPSSHLYPIRLTFTMLLVYEVLSMIFNLKYSVSNALGKQIEILSLIILRDGFKDLVYFDEPLSLITNFKPMTILLSDIFGAVVILIILGYYYKIQSHMPITSSEEEQYSFVSIKKCLALLILAYAILLGISILFGLKSGPKYYNFFDSLFTFLIFTDILIVFLAMRYTSNYYTIFRNSGFALTTVIIRIAITAPEYYRVVIGITAVLFAFVLTWAYNKFRLSMKHWNI